jgi:Cys-tRNA(Pro)/Cys-tRNA(Cys) deacylase
MTPGINLARKQKIAHTVHEYTHDPDSESYGQEAADKLGVPASRVFKTLVVALDNKALAVAVLPVSGMLSLKQMARAAGVKKATMAPPADVERATGYVLGGVSPLGQKKRLKTIIDVSAADYDTVYISAGRRGLEIELSPDDLKSLTNAVLAEICQ